MPFSEKVKRLAAERAMGRCELCTRPFMSKKPEFDHAIPKWNNGTDELSNCRVICQGCHDDKTRNEDVPTWAKSERILKRRLGIVKPRKITGWRNFSGEIVRKPRER